MKDKVLKGSFLLLLFLGVMPRVWAQQGIGTDQPNKSAALEIVSGKKGVLIPQVSLNDRTDTVTITEGNVNSLLVFNTHTAGSGADEVTPGYYYWSDNDNRWHRLLIDTDETGAGPWQVQGTADIATENTDDIYQTGRVAVGSDIPDFVQKPTFYVSETARIGDFTDVLNEDIGANSLAVGKQVIASGDYTMASGERAKAIGNYATATGLNAIASGNASFATGQNTVASAIYGVAMGFETEASGGGAVAMGQETKATADQSVAMGYQSIASGIGSTAIGFGTTAEGQGSFASGEGTIATKDGSVALGTFNEGLNNSILEIGIGSTEASRSNALTVLADGKMGLGMAGGSATPTEKLDVLSGNVRVRDLVANDGDSSDRIVVVDNNGVLKSVDGVVSMPKFFYMPSVLIPTASDQIHPSQTGSISFNDSSRHGEVDLYALYNEQFGGTSSTSVSSPGSGNLPVLDKTALRYHITFYDNEVFENVQVNADGELQYDVKLNAGPTSGTFMNIVFEVLD